MRTTPSRALHRRLRRYLRRLRAHNERHLVLIMAAVVGLLSGLAAVVLKTAVHGIQGLLQTHLYAGDSSYAYYLVPLVGLLATTYLARHFFREEIGHGITQLLYAISKNHAIVRIKRAATLMVTSALTVGFGGSLGLESPIVGTGAAMASSLARWINMGYRMRLLLIGCGAAGAIAGIFNSPIAGALFAIEVILIDVTIFQFMPVLIASVLGAVMGQTFLGDETLFSFALTDGFHHAHIPYYFFLSIMAGIAALHFLRMNYFVEESLARLSSSKWVRTLLGGGALVVLIMLLPPLYGEGYDVISALLQGEEARLFTRFTNFSLGLSGDWKVLLLLLLLLATKPMASAVTIGAGGSGGVFAPSLFMGAAGGYFFARALNLFFPALELSTSNFALAGMSAVMSAIFHAPLTAIFLIAEITDSYALFIPLMIAAAGGYLTMSYFERYSFYAKHLIERGDLIPSENRDERILSQMSLQALVESDLLSVSPTDALSDLVDRVRRSRRNIFPVLDQNQQLQGIVTLDDIREIMFEAHKRKTTRVEHLMSPPPEPITTNTSMRAVMQRFETSQLWNLPVADKNGKYIGFVSKSRVFNSYRERLIASAK